MKEYEYVVKVVEGYLCDELTGLICSENYRNKSYDFGYRTLFAQYRKLCKDFNKNYERFTDPAQEAAVDEEIKRLCQEKQQQVRSQILVDMQPCTDVDMGIEMQRYLQALEEEEVQSVAKRICLYPYLVSVFREHRKKEGRSDG